MSHFTEALFLKRRLNQLINENKSLYNTLKMLSEAVPPPPPPPSLAPDIDAPRNVAPDAEAPFRMLRTNYNILPEYLPIWELIRQHYGSDYQAYLIFTQWFNRENAKYINELISMFVGGGTIQNSMYGPQLINILTNFNEMWRLLQGMPNLTSEQRIRMFREILSGRQVNLTSIMNGLDQAKWNKLNELIDEHLRLLTDMLENLQNDLENISLDNMFRQQLLRQIDLINRAINHWNTMKSQYLGEILRRINNIENVTSSTLNRVRQQLLDAQRAANAIIENPNSTPEQISAARATLNRITQLLNDFTSGINNMSGPAKMAWFAAATLALISLWEIISQNIEGAGESVMNFFNLYGNLFSQVGSQANWPSLLNNVMNLWNWLHQNPYVSGAGSVEGSESGGSSTEFPYEFPFEYRP